MAFASEHRSSSPKGILFPLFKESFMNPVFAILVALVLSAVVTGVVCPPDPSSLILGAALLFLQSMAFYALGIRRGKAMNISEQGPGRSVQ
jgi:hypothetical protein